MSDSVGSANAFKKRVHLSLESKVQVINQATSNPSLTLRCLAKIFGCGKTQISDILRNKEKILLTHQQAPTCKRRRTSKYSEVNDALYQWYKLATSKSIHPNGPQLTAKGKEIAFRLGIKEFEGSHGWLDKWKKHYLCKSGTMMSGAISVPTVKERLLDLLQVYDKSNVYCLGETGLFWKALPHQRFGEKGAQCKGGERSNQRFTITFLANAAGDKEEPVVVWKSPSPRCFKGINKSQLSVRYYDQSESWMTANIFDHYLTAFNVKLKSQGRSILLVINTAKCHPEYIGEKYSNIMIVFLPRASKMQPLDLGIISNFKAHYRQLLLKFVTANLDQINNVTQVTSSINVLSAIRWVVLAWREVQTSTIVRCFEMAGVLSEPLPTSEDAIQSVEEIVTLGPLISAAMGSQDTCSELEYINGDNKLPVCAELEDECWDNAFMDSLSHNALNVTMEEPDSEENTDIPPPSPRLKSFKEAIESLKDVKGFLESRDCLQMVAKTNELISEVAAHATTTPAPVLTQYFSIVNE